MISKKILPGNIIYFNRSDENPSIGFIISSRKVKWDLTYTFYKVLLNGFVIEALFHDECDSDIEIL